MRILFSPVLNATTLVKYWQYFNQLGAIVGVIKPNHYLYVSSMTGGGGVIAILKYCVEVKHGNMADEEKVTVLLFQNTHPWNVPHYFCQGILRL